MRRSVTQGLAHGRHPRDDAAYAAQLQSQLDSLRASIVQIDGQGRIIHVNQAWRDFARDNNADPATTQGVGQNYLDACRSTGDMSAGVALNGLQEVLQGGRQTFEMGYRCHSPTERRWFRCLARAVDNAGRGVVVAHLDITELHLAETRSHIQASVASALTTRDSFLDATSVLATMICEQLDWDYAGIWKLDPSSWTLRCADTWIRQHLSLESFANASRAAALAPGVGLPGRVWETSKAVWFTDLDHDPEDHSRSMLPAYAVKAGFLSGFAFPLQYDGDILAVVEVFGRVRESLDPRLLRLLESCGAQLATGELRDRAERRATAAQAEADDAREQLEAVLDCAPATVVAVDATGAIRFVNKDMPPQRRVDMVGSSWTAHVAIADRARFDAALRAVLENGARQSFDTSVPGSDGRTSNFANYIGPMRSGDQVTGAVLVSQDVTQFKQAQADLFDAQRLASIGTLAAGVAHEINTPIQFIGDNIEFLREASDEVMELVRKLQHVCRLVERGALPDELQAALGVAVAAEKRADLDYLQEHMPKALERCGDGLTRVSTIVRSLKEVSHPSQKEMAPSDLNRAIAATLTVARSEYRYVADVETDFADIPLVVCHVNEINQVVLNIVINATHAIADRNQGTEERGKIVVRTWQEGPSVVISISDTGGGIPEHVRSRIWDPFFTTKEVGRGTGQGLAIARSVVKDIHRGELTFETKLGEGTVFFVRLPVAGKGDRISRVE
jgi:PAS domain S-box-containing protein